MQSARNDRKYDILLIGATGYTGALTAEHIARTFPGDLRWAIAGRSLSKLETIAAKLKGQHPDRIPPGIEIVALEDQNQVNELVKQAQVCISVVSYWSVGAAVIESCIQNGTDYIDTVGDTPLLHTFIGKFHMAAKSAGVALIHAAGNFSGPQDLLTWLLVRKMEEEWSLKPNEIILGMNEIELVPSGGSFESLEQAASLDVRTRKLAQTPWVLSPVEGCKTSTLTNGWGIRADTGLGLLSSSSFSASQNRAVVHRTWGLLKDHPRGYGPEFQYNEYDRVSSLVSGITKQLKSFAISHILASAMARSLIKGFFPGPGEGPDAEKAMTTPVTMQAAAIVLASDHNDLRRTSAKFESPFGAYWVTALFLAQGAASLLYCRKFEGDIEGGCLTPAILGQDLLDRVRAAGVTIS